MIAKEFLPPEVDRTQLVSLMELVSKIEVATIGGHDARILAEEFNTRTGKDYLERDFRDYHGAVSLETFVKTALLPRASKFPEVPDSQFLAVLKRLRDVDCDESEQTYWISFLEQNLECDEITDIIYWSDDNPSDLEILARAKVRRRSVIILPPGSG